VRADKLRSSYAIAEEPSLVSDSNGHSSARPILGACGHERCLIHIIDFPPWLNEDAPRVRSNRWLDLPLRYLEQRCGISVNHN
jgi:hypothetical protein